MPAKRKIVSEEKATAGPVESVMEPTGLLYAVSDFEYKPYPGANPVTVFAGEVFTPPPGWTRNLSAEERLHAEKGKQGRELAPAVIFDYEGEIINPHEKNPELRERRAHTAILPLQER